MTWKCYISQSKNCSNQSPGNAIDVLRIILIADHKRDDSLLKQQFVERGATRAKEKKKEQTKMTNRTGERHSEDGTQNSQINHYKIYFR